VVQLLGNPEPAKPCAYDHDVWLFTHHLTFLFSFRASTESPLLLLATAFFSLADLSCPGNQCATVVPNSETVAYQEATGQFGYD
jgi:hypothetical protein